MLTWAVIIGGIKSIGRAAEKLAPLKVGLYLIGGLIVIVTFADRLPHVFSMVFREALDDAVGDGLRRSSSRCATASRAASTRTKPATARPRSRTARRRPSNPTQQGLQAVMEVFIVSFVTATISAMTILVSGIAETSIAARQAGRARS